MIDENLMTNPCECLKDQFCQRYQREMGGRFRELCQGVNVDIGTSAAFREQWVREAGSSWPAHGGSPLPLLLKTDQMPGDAVAMTAAIYSLHRAHPGKYLTAVESRWPEVFAHNPDVVPVDSLTDPRPLHMHYTAIHACNQRGIHFMQAWCEHLSAALGVHVPLLTNRPHLYFDPFDYKYPPIEDYWVVCSGGKQDFTAKSWGYQNYQDVVVRLRDRVKFVQIGDNVKNHPNLSGVVRSESGYLCGTVETYKYIVGKTSLRQLFNLVRRARGVLCGVSLLMHVAAALEKPAIVIAGGREPQQWNVYPKQTYVHTVGALPCKSVQGRTGEACWRSRVVPLGDGSFYDQNTCERPVGGLPQCMTLIAPEEIARLVLRYNGLYENDIQTILLVDSPNRSSVRS